MMFSFNLFVHEILLLDLEAAANTATKMKVSAEEFNRIADKKYQLVGMGFGKSE